MRPSTSAMAATVSSAGVGTAPRSILRTVSSATPAAEAISRTALVPRARRSAAPSRTPRVRSCWVRARRTLLDVAAAVYAVARAHGYANLPDHGGHGIGRSMHEAPFVPNEPTSDAARHRLRAGNTIAIEPMLHAGTSRYRTKEDGWSIVTADGKRAAHFEHTVAVTDDGPEILTTPGVLPGP